MARGIKTMHLTIMLLGAMIKGSLTISAEEKSAHARRALDYVERVRNSPCTGGTEENLPVEFDHNMWNQYATVAIKTANLLTQLIIEGNNSLSNLNDHFLFSLVRNNVEGDSLIFGSAIATEEYVYPKYRIFCPYAYKKNGRINAHDLSLNYNYLSPSTEWYNTLRKKEWTNATVTSNAVIYRYNTSAHDIKRNISQPVAGLQDGHWTAPYYDCGGGDIWMVTFSAPFFARHSDTGHIFFRGVATIDIELTHIDINQCDLAERRPQASSGGTDVFRGTHQCKPSTKCVPLTGRGLQRGAYECFCRDGFYFPHTKAQRKSFNGTVLESLAAGSGNASLQSSSIGECLQCAEGCLTCIDDSPCLYSWLLHLRLIILVLSLALILGVVVVSVFVWIHREKQAIRSASPIFLHIMCVGAILMCITMVLWYPKPDNILCALRPWPSYVGFSMAYGALLLKTWRITAIFRVKSAKRVNLSDKVLAKRFLPILGVCLLVLSARTAAGRSEVLTYVMSDSLKFSECSVGWWEFACIGGAKVFLLWGAYLCYVVRKAPSNFNESKYITWAIYNNVILGTFILIISYLIAVKEGPDIMYVLRFIELQVDVTSMMCLIFIPKICAIYHADEIEENNSTLTKTKTTQGGSGIRRNQVDTWNLPVDTKDIAIQTDLGEATLAKQRAVKASSSEKFLSVNDTHKVHPTKPPLYRLPIQPLPSVSLIVSEDAKSH